jgi:hypothetical protein
LRYQGKFCQSLSRARALQLHSPVEQQKYHLIVSTLALRLIVELLASEGKILMCNRARRQQRRHKKGAKKSNIFLCT